LPPCFLIVRSQYKHKHTENMYTIKDLPTGRAIVNIADGIYVKKVKDGYLAAKKAPNMAHFLKTIKHTSDNTNASEMPENAAKFESIDELLNYLNEMPKPKKFNKDKHLQKSLNSLPADQKKAVISGILEDPTLKIGIQKSMALGFMDLPLFGGIDKKQTELF